MCSLQPLWKFNIKLNLVFWLCIFETSLFFRGIYVIIYRLKNVRGGSERGKWRKSCEGNKTGQEMLSLVGILHANSLSHMLYLSMCLNFSIIKVKKKSELLIYLIQLTENVCHKIQPTNPVLAVKPISKWRLFCVKSLISFFQLK